MKYRLKAIEVEAMEMTAPMEFTVGHGSAKTCQVGDFLVRNPDGTIGMVAKDAFFSAYESCDPVAAPVESKPKRKHRRRANGLGPAAEAMLREMSAGASEPQASAE